MKKALALILAMVMLSSMAAVSCAETYDYVPCIGVSIWNTEDPLGSACKLLIDEAAEALGVRVVWAEYGNDPEQVSASVVSLAPEMCDGIIVCCKDPSVMDPVIEFCNEEEIFLVQYFSSPPEGETYEKACTYLYYIGDVRPDDLLSDENTTDSPEASLYAFLMVYNVIFGNYGMYDTAFHDIPCPPVTDLSDYRLPYTADEIRQLATLNVDLLHAVCAGEPLEEALQENN